jgi:hypothetical protein
MKAVETGITGLLRRGNEAPRSVTPKSLNDDEGDHPLSINSHG